MIKIWKRDESSGWPRDRSADGHAAISRTGAEADTTSMSKRHILAKK